VVLSILAVCAGLSLLAWKGYHSVYMQPMVYAPPPPPIFPAARKVYPFSIIPGGVYSADELARSILLDPSLAEHYRDIRMKDLIAVRTQASMRAYVSFRRDGQIFWTSKKLTIASGEIVLTDGEHMIRGRCGNRIQEKRPKGAIVASTLTETPSVLERDIWRERGAEIPVVPEPRTLILFASGFLLLFLMTFPRG